MNDPEQTERFEFACSRCGADESVPFQPRNPDRLLCRECYAETGGKTYDLSRVTKAPRRKHNTRVAFKITCSECEKPDELDYVPKGVKVDELLCRECMEKRAGTDSRWALVQDQKLREQKIKPKYPFTCHACGCASMLPFRPHPDRQYDCYDCFLEKQRSDTPLESKAPKHDLGDNVFIRKKK